MYVSETFSSILYSFVQKLSPDLKRKVDEVKAQREGKNEMRKKLEVSYRLQPRLLDAEPSLYT
jgi:hypothetical protein